MARQKQMTRPLTPDQLAERWGCSGETVRAMIRNGELPAFRVGCMYRIRPETVEAHECQTQESEGSTDDLSSHGRTRTDGADAIVLTHARPRMRSAKPAT
ncbi:helix-turn-helix domain-containing protein [Pseudooceanicola atlanticus]|uniref:helix-turn-helix domain-containing protein n=1 Tax=Pseudooceanicola atlanticus TaxID=1461694 RepID=UPI003B5BAE5C